jgi:CTP synthase
VNPSVVEKLEEKGMWFVGHGDEGKRMEIMELQDHPYYVGVQYHPEYLTRPLKPSPPYLGLILAACGRLSNYLARGCRLSPDSRYGDADSEERSVSESSEEESSSCNHEMLADRIGLMTVNSVVVSSAVAVVPE